MLVADDEATIATLIEEALRKARHYVVTCEDGEQALEKLKKSNFSLLILDAMMPRKGGFQVLRELRAAGDDVPVIVLADISLEEAERFCAHFERVAVVGKPFTIAELLAAIRGLMGTVKS
jgi:DNA-binding response OmpR family regulator